YHLCCFFSSRRRHTRSKRDWSSDVCSSDLDMKEGVANVDLVVEAATENLDLKLKIFQDLESFTKPETILASNTSSISITKIASRSEERRVGKESIYR